MGRTPRQNVTCRESDQREQDCNDGEGQWIIRAYPIEQATHEPRKSERGSDPGKDTRRHDLKALRAYCQVNPTLPNDQSRCLSLGCASLDADTDKECLDIFSAKIGRLVPHLVSSVGKHDGFVIRKQSRQFRCNES